MIRNNVSQFREPLELSSAKCLTGWINIIREKITEVEIYQKLCHRACVREHAEYEFVEALVWHVFVNQDPFVSLNAISLKLHDVCVPKHRNESNLVVTVRQAIWAL